jgi:hypothetical protein
LFDHAAIIPDEQLTKWKIELTELKNLLTKHAVKVADDFEFNDEFVEAINGTPIILSEIELPKRIEVSNISTEITIPNLTELTLDDAIKEIAREKLALNVKYTLNEVPGLAQSLVTRTVPAHGSVVKPGDPLEIYYNDNPAKYFHNDPIRRFPHGV